MMKDHLSEQEIQQFVLEPQSCGQDIAAHVHSCPHCQAAVENYALIFRAIGMEPAVDFDMVSDVLDQIQPKPAIRPARVRVERVLIFGASGLFLAPLYYYRDILLSALRGSSTVLVGVSLTVMIVLILSYGISAQYKFKEQMDKLSRLQP